MKHKVHLVVVIYRIKYLIIMKLPNLFFVFYVMAWGKNFIQTHNSCNSSYQGNHLIYFAISMRHKILLYDIRICFPGKNKSLQWILFSSEICDSFFLFAYNKVINTVIIYDEQMRISWRLPLYFLINIAVDGILMRR